MRTFKIILFLVLVLAFTGCGKSVETQTPEPLKNITTQVNVSGVGNYIIMTDSNGIVTVQKLAEDGTVLEEVNTGQIINVGEPFDIVVNFSGEEVEFISPDGQLASIIVIVNGVKVDSDIVEGVNTDETGNNTDKESNEEEQLVNVGNAPVEEEKIDVKFKQVSSGLTHSCAIDTTGYVWCWGENDKKQISMSDEASFLSATKVAGPYHIESVSTGSTHTCALNAKQMIFCWGDGKGVHMVELKDSLPVKIAAGSELTCAIDEHEDVYCWGADGYAYNVANMWAAKEISAYSDTFCIIEAKESVNYIGCWEKDETAVSKTIEVKEPSKLSVGGYHLAYIDGDTPGSVLTQGDNTYGQIGNYTVGGYFDEPEYIDLEKILKISAGGHHTCAIHSDNYELYCWGNNFNGQTLPDTAEIVEAPKNLNLDLRAIDISAGERHTCLVSSDGDLYCFGDNVYGQLGNNTTENTLQLTKVQLAD